MSSCFTAKWVATDQTNHVIEFWTGEHGSDWYDSYFIDKAEEICPNGYRVLDKSFNPKQIPETKGSQYYYWTIRCNKAPV